MERHTGVYRADQRARSGLDLCLPSEAQWEYACRSGTTTPFSFGETITPEQVNYDGEHPYAGTAKGLYRQETVPVGSLPPNPWGLHEMHGNVWEWVEDAGMRITTARRLTALLGNDAQDRSVARALDPSPVLWAERRLLGSALGSTRRPLPARRLSRLALSFPAFAPTPARLSRRPSSGVSRAGRGFRAPERSRGGAGTDRSGPSWRSGRTARP